MKDYVRNSTKGSAMVDPVDYKGDAFVQCWVDSRVLATISNWLDMEGRVTRFLSEVVKDGLQILCDNLVEKQLVELVDDTKDARNLLSLKYRVNLNPKGRGMRNLRHNLVLSERRKKLGLIKSDFRGVSKVDVNSPMRVRSGSLDDEERRRKVDEALEIYRKIEEEEMKKSLEKQVEDFKRSSFVIKDEIESLKPPIENFENSKGFEKDVVPTVKENMSDEEWERKKMEIEKRDKERFEMEKRVDLEFLKTLMVEPRDKE